MNGRVVWATTHAEADMANNANKPAGASAHTKGTGKMEAVRQALAHFGNDAKPLAIRPWIKLQFDIELSNDQISNYKSDIRKKAAKRQALKAKKPTPSKAVPKKPAAPRPSTQQAAA